MELKKTSVLRRRRSMSVAVHAIEWTSTLTTVVLSSRWYSLVLCDFVCPRPLCLWLCNKSEGKYNLTWSTLSFQARSQNCEKRLLASPCRSVMEQICSHRTGFHKIWYSTIFSKIYPEIQVSLNSEKNNGYFTSVPMYMYDNISPISS
jgi:hypothetical protein